MKKMPGLGDLEMNILKFIDDHSAVAVRDVASHFEAEKGLARTTVLTVMERLRKKGYLARTKKDGVFLYTAKFEAKDVIKQKISSFVETVLGGSMSPFLNYFIESDKLSDREVQQLREIAARLTEPKDKLK